MTEEAEELLKVDVLGRVQVSRERREWLLDEFDRSGVVAGEFARVAGLKYSTFATWVQKRRRATGAGAMAGKTGRVPTRKVRTALPGPRFVEARIERSSPGPGGVVALRVELPCGARMEIEDVSQAQIAAALLRAMAAGGAGC